MKLAWTRALAWRLRRQLLDPVGPAPVEAVVRRLGAVPAGHDEASELAVRTRRQRSAEGDIQDALADGRIIMSFAFRGATHLMTPEDAGVYLALRGSGRMWELPSWQTYYGLRPADWPKLREVVREALAGGPLTVSELIAAIAAAPRFRHLGPILSGNPWSVMKAIAWQGDMSFGPARNRRGTFQLLASNPRWTGLPDLKEAGARAVETYLGTYGPATHDNLKYCLGNGLGAGGKHIKAALAALGERVAEVDVEGTPAMVLREHLDELAATEASSVVRLLPAYDPWVLGPGTADANVVPPDHRAAVSKGANVVLAGGVMVGTWSRAADGIAIEWFDASRTPPDDLVDAEIARLAALFDRSSDSKVRAA